MPTLAFKNISEVGIKLDEDLSPYHFITLDMDWAHDDIIMDTLSLLEQTGTRATWFVTHATPLLQRIRENPQFELGIHPNFNNLLTGGTGTSANAEEALDRIMDIVPEATAVRSHSLTQSSPLLDLFKKRGLIYDCNTFIPHNAHIPLRPWHHWNGLVKVPHFWEDDVEASGENPTYADLTTIKGPTKVFDFHPIHIFLNTDTPERYALARPHLQDIPNLLKYRNSSAPGSRTALQSLISPHQYGGRP